MSLPNVNIEFQNGALGGFAPMADGTCGLVVTAEQVGDSFRLNEPYPLRSVQDLKRLFVEDYPPKTPLSSNAVLTAQVHEFFAEAGNGARLWIMAVPETQDIPMMLNPNNGAVRRLIEMTNGEIRALGVWSTNTGYDAPTAFLNAQQVADRATDELFAPLFMLLPPGAANVPAAGFSALETNRVGIVEGNVNPDVPAIGLCLGRIARIPVHRHIGRVRDGRLRIPQAFFGDVPVSEQPQESLRLHELGAITFRTFVGKSGYYYTDDNLATAHTDDFRSIARRRTIDKAYRIAYQTLSEYINEEIPITAQGTIVPAMAKSIEVELEAAIIARMGAEGNLGTDPTDPTDTGVQCEVDLTNNIAATGRLNVVLRVKPYGYAKFIEVKLGFVRLTNN